MVLFFNYWGATQVKCINVILVTNKAMSPSSRTKFRWEIIIKTNNPDKSSQSGFTRRRKARFEPRPGKPVLLNLLERGQLPPDFFNPLIFGTRAGPENFRVALAVVCQMPTAAGMWSINALYNAA
jgi:hypothetical protein